MYTPMGVFKREEVLRSQNPPYLRLCVLIHSGLEVYPFGNSIIRCLRETGVNCKKMKLNNSREYANIIITADCRP